MTYKQLLFRSAAREKIVRGATQLADAIRITLARRGGRRTPSCDKSTAHRRIARRSGGAMPWNETHFPRSMTNLPPLIREKAIEIANALLVEGYEEGRAIRIAIVQAKRWAERRGS